MVSVDRNYQFDSMFYVFSKEAALSVVEEFEIMTFTKFNKLYYHKYDTSKSKIRWDRKQGLPYIIIQSSTYECEHGKNRDLARNERKRKSESRKRYNTVLPSKKKNCKAKITLLEIIIFPGFKVESSDRRETVQASQKLRTAIALNGGIESLTTEYRCYVRFPSTDHHSGHVVEPPVDYLVMEPDKILPTVRNLVKSGRCSIDVLKKSLLTYMDERPTDDMALSDKKFDEGLFKDLEEILSTSLQQALEITPAYVQEDTECYYVQSSNFIATVTLGNNDKFPECNCYHFENTLIPCKHMLAVVQNCFQSSLECLPFWYLQLVQLCAPKMSETHRRSVIEKTSKVNDLLQRFRQQVDEGRLSLDELTAMEIGLSSINDQLPASSESKFKPPSISLSKPKKSCIPSLSLFKHVPLEEPIITNGPHGLSLIKLKTLEGELKLREKRAILAVDKNFREGFLDEDIINSYLYLLCEQDGRCVYISTKHLNMLANGVTVSNQEWIAADQMAVKRFIFLPWVGSENKTMVLLIIDISQKALVYLNPLHIVDINKSEVIQAANDFVSGVICPRFNFEIHQMLSLDRTIHHSHDLPARVRNGQENGFNSLLVCMYAKWYTTNDGNLLNESEMNVFREEIYTTIVGSCLDKNGSKQECRICTSAEIEENELVLCIRCNQRYHLTCLNSHHGNLQEPFVCPPSEPLETGYYWNSGIGHLYGQ